MGYLLFFSGRTGYDTDHLKAAGLADLVRPGEPGPHWFECQTGSPDNKGGIFCGWDRANIGYYPERQTWAPLQPLPGVWICIPKEGLKPDSIRRGEGFQGLPTRMGDGQDWELPSGLRLPHKYAFGPSGSLERVIADRGKAIYERTLWALETYKRAIEEDVDIPTHEAFLYVCEMLALNYKVTPELVAHLGLIDDQNLYSCMARTTDVLLLMELQLAKKKEQSATTNVG